MEKKKGRRIPLLVTRSENSSEWLLSVQNGKSYPGLTECQATLEMVYT